MPELIPNERLFGQLADLGPGDLAHHSMLYPGVYPSDRETHEHMRRGGTLNTTNEFFTSLKTAVNNGARVEWLCTLPRAGEYGCDDEDIQLRLRMMGAIAALGVDVRSVVFNDYAPTMYEYLGEDSPVVEDVRAGLERGDPRKSSWALFRKMQAGQLAIAHLNTMDYEGGAYLGRLQHYPPGPVDPDIGKWTFGWREVYANHGEKISPLSA
jgi:hypothetical protein